jgi:hypothetical protein
VHQATDRVVRAQVAVGLLVDALGVFGAQYDARSALMGLELVERTLEFPALAVAIPQVRGSSPPSITRLAPTVNPARSETR